MHVAVSCGYEEWPFQFDLTLEGMVEAQSISPSTAWMKVPISALAETISSLRHYNRQSERTDNLIRRSIVVASKSTTSSTPRAETTAAWEGGKQEVSSSARSAAFLEPWPPPAPS